MIEFTDGYLEDLIKSNNVFQDNQQNNLTLTVLVICNYLATHGFYNFEQILQLCEKILVILRSSAKKPRESSPRASLDSIIDLALKGQQTDVDSSLNGFFHVLVFLVLRSNRNR